MARFVCRGERPRDHRDDIQKVNKDGSVNSGLANDTAPRGCAGVISQVM